MQGDSCHEYPPKPSVSCLARRSKRRWATSHPEAPLGADGQGTTKTHLTQPFSLSSTLSIASGRPTHQHPAPPARTYFPCFTKAVVGRVRSIEDRTSLVGEEAVGDTRRRDGSDVTMEGPEEDEAEAIGDGRRQTRS